MLDFTVEYSSEIKVFTNVKWIKEKYKFNCLKFVGEYEDSDICILDYNYRLNNDSRFKISIDNFNTKVDAFINRRYIEAYFNLLEKFNSDVCGIGMIDISDVKLATKGILVEYIKVDITCENEVENIKEFKKNLKGGSFEGSAILFISVKDYLMLNSYAEAIVELYGEIDIVLFAPSNNDVKLKKYVELFVFKRE